MRGSTSGDVDGATSPGGGGVEVREVRTSRDIDAFVRFPWRIYAGDPHWVPPLILERKEFIDPRKHPFYLHGMAAQFLAYRNGECVGRILASDDPRFNQEHGTNCGCFGMFESVDDQAVAHALLDAAAGWLKARGRNQVLGPADYSTNYECGLLVSGFDTPPRIMMNHNPPYYAALLESWGLTKAKDLYSWWFDRSSDLAERWQGRAEKLAARGGFTIRPFRLKDFKAEVEHCKKIYNEAWQRNWGFVKMSDAEFEHLGKHLRDWAVPELLLLAEIEGKPVGFSMTLPDMNEAIAPLNGRLTSWGLPIGLYKLWRNSKQIKTCRLVTLGVLEQYRRRGITELLILKTFEHGKNTMNYDAAELGWTLEDNTLINRTIEAVGAKHYKTYRLYQKGLA
jgi:GNAT superfamily N-acetyltransferase